MPPIVRIAWGYDRLGQALASPLGTKRIRTGERGLPEAGLADDARVEQQFVGGESKLGGFEPFQGVTEVDPLTFVVVRRATLFLFLPGFPLSPDELQ